MLQFLIWLKSGFTFKQSVELWKYKLKLFNPLTFQIFKCIKLQCMIIENQITEKLHFNKPYIKD